ncbi:hypothetical protein ACROYT_G042667 [Oculina patagonica]
MGAPLEEHHWGIPSKFCDGFEKSSPRKDAKGAFLDEDETAMASLAEELKALDMEEQALRRHQNEAILRAKIAEKRKIVEELKQQKLPQDHSIGHNPGNLTTRELSKLELDGAVGQQTPLDELLKSMDPVQDQRMDGAAWGSQPPFNRAPQGFHGFQAWQTIPQPWQAPQTNTEMFLKPGRMEKGEKPILIVDFVNNIVPQDEEETLGNQGNAKIVVTYGPKKPKLESITLQQWVVGNTRIFYTLLSQGKLVSQVDIQNYLAYTVKIMELSSNGFKLIETGTSFLDVDMDNYKSATNPVSRPKVEQTIRDEIAQRNYVISAVKPRIIAPAGFGPEAKPEEASLESPRIYPCLFMMSIFWPHGQAVNDYISTDSFKFQTLDDAVKLLKANYYMAKIDLRHAYRSVPIHPDNYQATGCKWQFSGDKLFTYFYDTRLPFGAKSSPEIFHRLTQSVRRMMARRGFTDIIVYLDDFLIIGDTREQCQLAYDTLFQLLLDLGFSISDHKLVTPTQRLTFLGVQLDTTACTMTLPDDKLAELLEQVIEFQNKQRATKKQLQRLAGKLNWACRVVYGGRTFLWRILDTMNALSPSGKYRLDQSFRNDLE